MVKKGAFLSLFMIFALVSFAETKNFTLGSPVFEANAFIPEKYTCKGADISPALFWENPPDNTKSFALIIEDPEAPDGTWVHWILFNIPPEVRNLTEGDIPPGAISGKNSWGISGYKGPCPPLGDTHRYVFKLYALDITLPLNSSAMKQDVIDAIQYHVIGMSEFTGSFTRE